MYAENKKNVGFMQKTSKHFAVKTDSLKWEKENITR